MYFEPVGQQMEIFDFNELLLPLVIAEALFQPCVALHAHMY